MPINPRVFHPAGIKLHRDDENASGTMHQKRRTAGVGLLPNLVTASQRAARTASALVSGHGDAVTNGPSPWRTPNAAAPLYGIVIHLPGARRTVAETVITFDSTASAEAFARAQGWTNYQVSQIRFVESFGDVEVVMLFRPGGPTAGGEGNTCPAGPA